MTKNQARQRIRTHKQIIHNSIEKFAEALANNHYKTANVQSVILAGNFKELNNIRNRIKDGLYENNA